MPVTVMSSSAGGSPSQGSLPCVALAKQGRPFVSSEVGVAHNAAVTEWIRVWAYEVQAYQREGWRLSHVRRGLPSEELLGADYADCVMMREVRDG